MKRSRENLVSVLLLTLALATLGATVYYLAVTTHIAVRSADPLGWNGR